MPSITDSLPQPTQLAAVLATGEDVLSGAQDIVFTKYIRVVLPMDGFVFWVKADLLGPSVLANTGSNFGGFNAARFDQPLVAQTAAPTMSVRGSFHYAAETRQEEDATFGRNMVIFTAQAEIQEFDQIDPNTLWLGTFDDIRFSFSSWQPLYRQAGLFHYRGDAIYSWMESQIVDSLAAFDSRNVIVSNSLPIWLAMNAQTPVTPDYPPTQPIALFPSFLVPDNLPPTYGVVHIYETQAIASVPLLGPTLSHTQLCQEKVRITFYGLRNFNAQDWIDFAFNYMTNAPNDLGLLNMPVLRDDKRTQSELSAIAMKKSIEFEVSYLQSRARDIARQLILSCVPSYIFSD